MIIETRPARLSLLSLLLLAPVLSGCGLVWWGAAAAGGYLLYDASAGDDDEEVLPPVIESLSADEGQEIGGRAITISGKRFRDGARVFFGTEEATSVTVCNAWLIETVTPPYDTAGASPVAVEVKVVHPDGSEAVLASGFTYVDTIAPAVVTDLQVARAGGDDVTVSFTAPGDNGIQGTAQSYDLRFYDAPLTESNWSFAWTTLDWSGPPGIAGTPESETFTLTTMDSYFFALKTTDDEGLVSPLSNVVGFDAFAPGAARDLRALPGAQRGAVALRWRTSADDGLQPASGDVTAYDVRYASSPILSDADFDASDPVTKVNAPWTPQSPGQLETREVLLPAFVEGRKYYFALKILDEFGNASPLSAGAAEMIYAKEWHLSDARLASGGLPPGRRHAAVAVDARFRRLVAYGGHDGSTDLNRVVALRLRGDGMGWWEDITPTLGGPSSGRRASSAVWDPLNHRIVIFGGVSGSTDSNEVWALDLSGTSRPTWSDLTPSAGTSPTPRHGCSAVYDDIGKRMIVIGGRNGTTDTDEVWALDLSPGATPSWNELQNLGTAFTARWGAAAAFNPRRNHVVVFGGHTGVANPASTSETFLLDLADTGVGDDGEWHDITPAAGEPRPGARGEAACAFDPCTGRLIVGGGRLRWALQDLIYGNAWACEVEGGTSHWYGLQIKDMPGLWGAGGLYDPVNQRMVLYGGAADRPGLNLNQAALDLPLRSLEVEAGWWVRPPSMVTPEPEARWGHAAAFDPRSGRLLLHGGRTAGGIVEAPWSMDPSDCSWVSETIGGMIPGPGSVAGHLMVTDPVERRILLFGGDQGGNSFSNALHAISHNGSAFTWSGFSPSTTATARAGAAGCYDPLNHRLVVYGGENSSGVVSSLEAFDLTGGDWSVLLVGAGGSPGPLKNACAVYDPEGRCMVLFGGEDDNGQKSSDVWLLHMGLSGTVFWTRLKTSSPGPGARSGASGYYDAPNHRAVFFGGQGGPTSSSNFQDVWALYLNGHTQRGSARGVWVELDPFGAPPAPRAFASLVRDPRTLKAFGFGGATVSLAPLAETHSLAAPAPDPPAYAWNLSPGGASTPSAREGHAAVADLPKDRMIVVGGYDGSLYHSEIWALDKMSEEGSETWAVQNGGAPPLPARRAWHGLVLHPAAAQTTMFMFGGKNATQYFQDVWILAHTTGTHWTWSNQTGSISGTPPSGRARFAFGFDVNHARLLVYGGETAPGVYSGEVWALNLEASGWNWELLAPGYVGSDPPAPRAGMTSFMADGAHLIVFGGENGSGPLNDAFMLVNSGTVLTWVPLPASGALPDPRCDASGFLRPFQAGFFVFGGDGGGAPLADLWRYKSLSDVSGAYLEQGLVGKTLAGRAGASCIFEEMTQRALLFGGRTAGSLTDALSAINVYQPVKR